MIGRRIWPKPFSVAVLFTVYAAALAIAWPIADAALAAGDWESVLFADVAATTFVFVMALAFDNTSVYDPYWSVAPFAIVIWWGTHGDPDLTRFAVVAFLIGLWGARLTANFLEGWPGLHHEDWRYTEYRRFGVVGYWMISFAGLQMMPTLIVFAGMIPVLAIVREPGNPLGWMDAVAIVVTAGFVLLETVADEQKRRYEGEGFITSGVWAWMRHPNYLGEVGFWWGLWLFALAAGWTNWWTVIGPAAMTVLFVFISVPLMDRRMQGRPGYPEHIATSWAMVPKRPQG